MSLHMAKVRFSDTRAFVITGRNRDNTTFYLKPKSAFIWQTELANVVLSSNEGFEKESGIIEMIDKGIYFYTFLDGSFTEVKVVKGHLRTVGNNTEEDNILNLPILEE